MKSLFIILFYSVCSLSHAQSLQANYDYTIRKDSINPKGIINDVLSVLHLKDQTIYYLDKNIQNEKIIEEYKGILNADNTQEFIDKTSQYYSDLANYALVFNHEKNTEILYLKNTDDNSKYKLETIWDKPTWKLEKETKKTSQFLLKKATTNFLNRNWIAWYTEDIPTSIAPYKFYGLPGLLVSITDENSFIKIDLLSIKEADISSIESVKNYIIEKENYLSITEENLTLLLDKLDQNKVNNLLQSGIQYDEEFIKKVEKYRKKRKPIYLNPKLKINL